MEAREGSDVSGNEIPSPSLAIECTLLLTLLCVANPLIRVVQLCLHSRPHRAPRCPLLDVPERLEGLSSGSPCPHGLL